MRISSKGEDGMNWKSSAITGLVWVLCAVAVLLFGLALRKPVALDRRRRRIARVRMRRLIRTYDWVGGIIMVLLCVPIFASAFFDVRSWYHRVAELIASVLIVLFAVAYHKVVGRRLSAIIARVQVEEYRVCLRCQHSLRDLGDAGRCPECGHEFSYPALVEGWQDMKYVLGWRW
jgi:uncharacterized paraquat-inducible protein A